MEDSAAQRGKSRDRAVLLAAGSALLARGVSAVVTIATIAIAAKVLHPAELGVVAVLTTIGVFITTGDLGLGVLLMSRLPEANARGDLRQMRDLIRITLGTLLLFGALIAILGSLSAWVLPWQSLLGAQHLPANEVRLAVVAFFVTGCLSIPAAVIVWVLSAMLKGSIVQLWTAASAIISLVAVGLCAALKAPIWAYVLAILGVPTAVGFIQTAWVLTALFPGLRPHTLAVSASEAKGLLSGSTAYAVINLTGLVYTVGSLVVASVMGAHAAATFALVSRMFTLIGATLLVAGQQMWSALVDAIQREDHAWATSRFKRSLQVSALVALVGCALMALIARPAVGVWIGHQYEPPWSFVLVLAAWTVYYPTVQQSTYLLVATGRVGTLARASALGAPINLGLSIWLTEQLGLVGPVLGSAIAANLTLLPPVVYYTRRYLRDLRRSAAASAAGPASAVQ